MDANIFLLFVGLFAGVWAGRIWTREDGESTRKSLSSIEGEILIPFALTFLKSCGSTVYTVYCICLFMWLSVDYQYYRACTAVPRLRCKVVGCSLKLFNSTEIRHKVTLCAAGFALLNLPKGKSLGRSKPATNSYAQALATHCVGFLLYPSSAELPYAK
jgi:hypothetical protein